MQGRDVGFVGSVRGGRSDLVSRVLSAFSENDYRIVSYVDTRGCVDIVAKREDSVFVVRILHNVDSLREESVSELSRLASALNGIPLIVGERTKRGPLEENVVYRRYGVAVVTPNTLSSILSGDLPPYEEYRGQKIVYIDSEKLRAVRTRLGLSQGDLARRIGVAKETVYRYEHGAPASYEVARRLEEVLGEDVSKPVELSSSERVEGLLSFRRAPWDYFVSSRITVALSRYGGLVRRKVEVLARGKGIAHDLYALVAPDDEKKIRSDVPVIPEDDLRELRPKELAKKVRDLEEDQS